MSGYQSKYTGGQVENILDNAILKTALQLTDLELIQIKANLKYVTGEDVNNAIGDAISSIPTPDVSRQINEHNNDKSAHPHIQSELAEVKSSVPSKVSQLENDKNYLTEHQDISHLATKEELQGKQDVIQDLNDIRDGASKGATALQSVPEEYVTMDELDRLLSESPFEFVDLGLPSGTLWATCNIGAANPEEAGLYFAWGEIEGYKVSYTVDGTVITSTTITDKDSNTTDKKFSAEHYKWCDGDLTKLTKYNYNSNNGVVDNLNQLVLMDDAVYAVDRHSRMPSVADFEELIANTTFSKVIENNRACGKFTAANGKSIILPVVGRVNAQGISGINAWAVYPTRELYKHNPSDCLIMYFTSSYSPSISTEGRSVGLPIRAVKNKLYGNDDYYYTKEETNVKLEEKQDVISDIETIRNGAALGTTAIQEERYKGTISAVDTNETVDEPEMNNSINVLDNGNIKVTINGVSKDFMPATPSGDSQHYVYEGHGAIYNDGDDYITETKWKDLVDDVEYNAAHRLNLVTGTKVKTIAYNGVNYDIYEQGHYKLGNALKVWVVGVKSSNGTLVYDDTKVVHRKGYWLFNSLGDLTNQDMMDIVCQGVRYIATQYCYAYIGTQYTSYKGRTNLPTFGNRTSVRNATLTGTFYVSAMDVCLLWPYYDETQTLVASMNFLNGTSRHITGCNIRPAALTALSNSMLSTIPISEVNKPFNITGDCISKKTILKAINSEKATTAITIGLTASVFNRVSNEPDILEALSNHPNVTLVTI